MKVFVIGSKRLGVDLLDVLVQQGHDVLGVFTRDEESSMQVWLNELGHPSLKEQAISLNIPVYEGMDMHVQLPRDIIQAGQPDVIFSCFWGQILKEDLLNLPKLGIYNLHTALLPKNRGSRPIPWAIIRGEQFTGVTLHRMMTGVDNGPIVAQAKVHIDDTDTCLDLYNKVSLAGTELFKNTLPNFANGTFQLHLQEQGASTYHPRGEPYGRQINAFWSPSQKDRFRRAFTFPPFPKAIEAPENFDRNGPAVYSSSFKSASHYHLDKNFDFHAFDQNPAQRRATRQSIRTANNPPLFIPVESELLIKAYKLLDLLRSTHVPYVTTLPVLVNKTFEASTIPQPFRHVNGVLELPVFRPVSEGAWNRLMEIAREHCQRFEADVFLPVVQDEDSPTINTAMHLELADIAAHFNRPLSQS